MKDTILDFVESKKIAVIGASPNKENFGRHLHQEFIKMGIESIPVNPKYEEVEGVRCVPTARELPEDVESAIIAVSADMTDEIVEQCIGSPVKRVWMIQGVGRGAYTESARKLCQENNIEVVHGFCPMMFFGSGMHKFHFWLRKTFGKLPKEYLVGQN
jgi:acyl-CoA synthetase (NDP forming)